MSWEFERVAGPFETTEGPVWDGSGVLFTDMPTSRVMRYDEATGECDVYRSDTNNANGLKLGPDGDLYAPEMGGRRVVRYEADGGETVVAESFEGKRLNSPNDIAFDGDGRLWFTDPFYDVPWQADDHEDRLELGHFSVYRLDPTEDWAITRMTYDTTNPNGLLVGVDDETLYVAQSQPGGKNELRAYPIEGDELGEMRVLHNFAPHRGIDGMCRTDDGNIVATAGSLDSGPGPMLYVFTPSGRVLETHPVPDPKPTNCCFGGDDLTSVFVTGFDGCLYRADTDRTGFLRAP